MHSDDHAGHLPGTTESIYGGFGARFGALLIDALIALPVGGIALYIQSFGRDAYFMSVIPMIAFGLWYNVYLPQRYGGTPGKLLAGLTILKTSGDPIGLKEAFMRNIVSFGISLFSVGVMCIALTKADHDVYTNLGWIERSQYLVSLVPLAFTIQSWASNVWLYSELIVLLTNKERRGIHDFIAGTVIVKTKYLPQIYAYTHPTATPIEEPPTDYSTPA